MGTLLSFSKYLSDRERLLAETEEKLLKLQESYENHLAEIRRVREAELDELMETVLADRGALPKDFNQKLDEAAAEAEKVLSAEQMKLEKEKDAELKRAEELRQKSLMATEKLKSQNVRLDKEEEELKARSAILVKKIEVFNAKIAELGHGFGFFSNLFKMRKIADQRDLLEKENAELAARIELLRARWEKVSAQHVEDEAQLKIEWTEAEEHAMALAARLEALESRRSRMIARSALDHVLKSMKARDQDRADGGRSCPRCSQTNDQNNHFCWACASRLQENDPGFQGSVEEMVELNHHLERFSRGVHSCRGIIALVRGLQSGLAALKKSVTEMVSSQDSYSLGTLEIDVPQESVNFGEYFDQLAAMVEDNPGLHPLIFADRIDVLIRDRFTEEQIKNYFERMGEELSRQAGAQW